MQTLLKYLSAGALSLVSLGALSSAPAIAASIIVTSTDGTAPTDYLVYDANGTNTFEVAKTLANIQNVLGGDAASPTGNVELRARTEKPEFDPTKPEFDPTAFTKNTTLSGAIGGKSITLSSLTASDWATANYNDSGKTFGKYWFDQALTNNGLSAVVGTPTADAIFGSFVSNGGFQRFSDPNISYVNQNDTTGLISIGLAGHYDATSLLFAVVPSNLQPLLAGKTIQASELVKYTYDGQSGYLFSFSATQTGLVELKDKVSHSGNYEVTLRPVPVPAAFVGIAIAGAIGAAKLKRSKVTIKA